MFATRERIRIPSGHSFRILYWEETLRNVQCLLSPGESRKVVGEGADWHFHPEMELTLFTAGHGTRFVGDHIAPFASGDLVLLGERLPHYWHVNGSSSGISIQWHFPQSHAFWAFPENLALLNLWKSATHGLHLSGATASAIAVQMQAMKHGDAARNLATLLGILAKVATTPADQLTPLSARCFSISTEHCHQEAIANAVRYLAANFRDIIRLEDLLRVTGMSRPTFARQFKAHTGSSFSSFLNQLRMEAACKDLRESEQSILDIALASGFTQLSFFNRLFRSRMKETPRQYRIKFRRKSPLPIQQ